jgi:membrane protein DedA with SNARE-associated domain
MEWLNSLLTYLTSGVNFSHPFTLTVLFILGMVSELGFPLFFSLEIFLFFISFDSGPLSVPALLVVLMLLLGRELGANVLYLLTRTLGSRFLDWLEKRSTRTMKAVEQFKTRVNKNPTIMVTIVRITPGLLQVPAITAGAIRLKPLSFAEGVALSSVIYDFIFLMLGLSARFILPHINAQPKTFLLIGFGCLIVLVWLVLFFAYRHHTTRNKKQKERLI